MNYHSIGEEGTVNWIFQRLRSSSGLLNTDSQSNDFFQKNVFIIDFNLRIQRNEFMSQRISKSQLHLLNIWHTKKITYFVHDFLKFRGFSFSNPEIFRVFIFIPICCYSLLVGVDKISNYYLPQNHLNFKSQIFCHWTTASFSIHAAGTCRAYFVAVFRSVSSPFSFSTPRLLSRMPFQYYALYHNTQQGAFTQWNLYFEIP